MSTPTPTIDIENERRWLQNHKHETGLSWSELAKRTGLPDSTISLFGGKNGYPGKEERPAEHVRRYREMLSAHEAADLEPVTAPAFFQTETSQRLHHLFLMAQRGKMYYVSLPSGLGKSTSARQFQQLYPNVILATMRPSSAGLMSAMVRILSALGQDNAKGAPDRLSAQIVDHLKKLRHPLLLIDEAQELTIKAMEEIRAWSDEIGLGVVFMGDMRLHKLIQTSDVPQLRRRMRPIVWERPFAKDVEALADAWNVTDPKCVKFLGEIAEMGGGLGNPTETLCEALLISRSQSRPLEVADLKEAWVRFSARANRS
ncbi:hypothetical protein D2V17_14335 [Aurantiacibacter xanthus]|uniref:ATP-binding protein n=1 Tax=Aurantiacibacter xanthus TaxID=1784712 RepID=A0A3A1P1E7_9SPHN|nr:AAA family ATPase [Aurantiacibacter xanthus]RIV82976.1 hypothetical protein D2V17_14335 [Aurantiacibacter xanthus]